MTYDEATARGEELARAGHDLIALHWEVDGFSGLTRVRTAEVSARYPHYPYYRREVDGFRHAKYQILDVTANP